MSSEAALLAAIWDRPHDDLPRLVYADWLDETGDPAKVGRAEFIRVQCELALLDVYDPRRNVLHKRERVLWKKYAASWRKGLPAKIRQAEFSRGFVAPEERKLAIAAFLKLTPDDLTAAPTWSCKIDDPRDAEPIATSDNLLRFESLKFWSGITAGGAERMLSSYRLRNVATLFLGSSLEWLHGLRALAGNKEVRNLTSLDIYDGLSDEHIGTICEGLAFATLRTLIAYRHTITAVGLKTLFNSQLLSNLSHLTLPCWYGDDGARAIAKSKPTFQLQTLSMYGYQLTDAGVAVVANWPGMSSVRKFHVSGQNQVLGPAALASSPFTRELRELNMGHSKFDRAGALALARSKSLQKLERLHIENTPAATDPEAVKVLVERFGQDSVKLRYPGQRKPK